jgi:hypothetical protein
LKTKTKKIKADKANKVQAEDKSQVEIVGPQTASCDGEVKDTSGFALSPVKTLGRNQRSTGE